MTRTPSSRERALDWLNTSPLSDRPLTPDEHEALIDLADSLEDWLQARTADGLAWAWVDGELCLLPIDELDD